MSDKVEAHDGQCLFLFPSLLSHTVSGRHDADASLRPGTPRTWSGRRPSDSCAPSLLLSLQADTAPAAAGAWRSVLGLEDAAVCSLARLHDATPAPGRDVCTPLCQVLLSVLSCNLLAADDALCSASHDTVHGGTGPSARSTLLHAALSPTPALPRPPRPQYGTHTAHVVAIRTRTGRPKTETAQECRHRRRRPRVSVPAWRPGADDTRGGHGVWRHAWEGLGPAPPGVPHDPVAVGRADGRPPTAHRGVDTRQRQRQRRPRCVPRGSHRRRGTAAGRAPATARSAKDRDAPVVGACGQRLPSASRRPSRATRVAGRTRPAAARRFACRCGWRRGSRWGWGVRGRGAGESRESRSSGSETRSRGWAQGRAGVHSTALGLPPR